MISTRGRYAVRVLIDIAENDNGKYIPLKDIADRQDMTALPMIFSSVNISVT